MGVSKETGDYIWEFSFKNTTSDFPGQGCAWKASCQGLATWEHNSIFQDLKAVQYFCSEEQKQEAEGLPLPFADWVPLNETLRDSWSENCTVVGEDCGPGETEYFNRTCVTRFDEYDEAGNTFSYGKICTDPYRGPYQIVESCFLGMRQYKIEEETHRYYQEQYGHKESIYCPSYDPEPRAYWTYWYDYEIRKYDETQEKWVWLDQTKHMKETNCNADSDCAKGHLCLKQTKVMNIYEDSVDLVSGYGCAK